MQLTCKRSDCVYCSGSQCLLQEISLDESGVCQNYCPGLPEEWRRTASPQQSVRRSWEQRKKQSRKQNS